MLTSPFTILHLSDIQFGRNHRYPKGKDSYDNLFAKLSTDLDLLKKEHGVQPDAIVVSGDVAEWSMPDEYKQASDFLERLITKIGIAKDRIVIVPGNHDVNRKLCQGARFTAEGKGEAFEEPYFAKFGNYQKFFDDFHEGRRFFDEINLCHVYRFDEEQTLIVGFNSCIRESEEKEDHYGWIGLDQVHAAVERCEEIDPDRSYLRIAVIHHNFTSGSDRDDENLRDADAIRPALEGAEFCIILHGHRHEADIDQHKRPKARHPLTILAAGSAGLDAKALPDHPNQYQIIRIENGNDLTVFMRQYSAKTFGATGKGKWTADPSVEEMAASSRLA